MFNSFQMEERESTLSGSGGSSGNSGTESPPAPTSVAVAPPQVMNTSVEATAGAAVTTAPTAVAPGSGPGGSGSGDLFGKKKRGRPRKYDEFGNLRVSYKSPSSGFSLTPSPNSSEFSSSKRGRGRPPGSGNWQLLASFGEIFASTAGGDFTPHVVTVGTGEDVAGKILSFAQKGTRGICILSANGSVSNVTIRQPGSSGGLLTYEGRFEILSLTGSFTVSDAGGVKSRKGGLSVSLAGPDGRVIGGGVAGLLTAASPIQIVVGSFMPNGYKVHKRKPYREPMPTSPPTAPEPVTMATPISQANPEGQISLTPASPLPGQSHGDATDDSLNEKQAPNPISAYTIWNGSEVASEQRPSPDINMSAPSE